MGESTLETRPVPGAVISRTGVTFTLRAPGAQAAWVCLFDEADRETARHVLEPAGGDLFSAFIARIDPGARYGLRADGPWVPEAGHRFDRSKLLVDPYATRLDRPFAFDPRLCVHGEDTADLVPKALVEHPVPDLPVRPPLFSPGGLIYEIPVRAFTLLHPDIPEPERGTLAALAHPAIIAHLKSLNVSAIELMPIAAWIDECHLDPLGLSNAWGYNPVTMLALDPRLAPGGIADLRRVCEALHGEGIGVIVDVVFNHTGESDIFGPTLSLRGLGNTTWYRHEAEDPGRLVNDTGCGNTLACDRPEVQHLVLAAMRHLVLKAGVDGFRFDLAPVLARDASGFSPDAELLRLMRADTVIGSRILIAEPWDVGPGGYQLGNFPASWLEWNDRARDDIRAFWRGDQRKTGALATRLAGSSDIFGESERPTTRAVNFVAAHDGFPLGDIVMFESKHNEANGEENRDGHDENFSWNNGVEGTTADPAIATKREADARALIATLFSCRGTILLTAGDEFGHSQGGNNNAYAQDNETTWRDWANINRERLEFTRAWAALRAASPHLRGLDFLVEADGSANPAQVSWHHPDGALLAGETWNDPEAVGLVMVLGPPGNRLTVAFNRADRDIAIHLPGTGGTWEAVSPGTPPDGALPARSVGCWREV